MPETVDELLAQDPAEPEPRNDPVEPDDSRVPPDSDPQEEQA